MSDTIVHYGIKGMKWGIRRSEAELARARGDTDKAKAANKKEVQRRKSVRKNRRTMSTESLQKEVNRLALEKRYKDLVDEDVSPGRTAVKRFLKSAGGRVLSTAAVGSLAYAGYLAVSGKSSDPVKMAEYLFPNPNRKKK